MTARWAVRADPARAAARGKIPNSPPEESHRENGGFSCLYQRFESIKPMQLYSLFKKYLLPLAKAQRFAFFYIAS